MTPQAANRPSPPGLPDLEALLVRFDQLWQQGVPPRIDEVLAVAAGFEPAQRRAFLEELVMIDLEYRWRLAALGIVAPAGLIRERPRLEDYVAHYAELGGLPQLSPELIGAEYRVRRRWGDRPGQAEYTTRFPRQGPQLSTVLRQIDADLTKEFAEQQPPAVRTEAPPDKARSGSPGAGVLSVPALVEVLGRGELLGKAQLDEVSRQLAPRLNDARSLARELLQRGWLTPYQVNQLFLGRAADLRVGPYLLLERLGEGGAGQVFKARHLRMNRVVALKLLRKELLADADLVQRFYREIRVLSQLEHPNIVHALDAGPEGSAHLLVMECVEGIDLARLVKQHGPLPVAQACDYIRQAASGLAYAHERGLVHRDIKPHNLIVAGGQWPVASKEPGDKGGTKAATSATVKVLDLGLARLRQPMDSDATAHLEEHLAGSLTPVGAVMMGTADYMAPEQALDFHTADIRADIYSLGATFHFLLTGQPPFPGGTLAQKLLKHQQAEAPTVVQARPEVSPAISAVVRKMLAKRPEDRYQSPADVVRALDGIEAQRPARLPFGSRSFWRRGAAVGLLLIGAVCLLLWLIGPSSPDSSTQGAGKRMHAWRHGAAVRQVVFSPDGKLIYSGSDDCEVLGVDRFTGRPQPVLDLKRLVPNATGVAFSPEGATLAVAAGPRNEESVRLWNLATQEEFKAFRGHAVVSPLQAIVLAPENKGLVLIGGGGNRFVKLVNTSGRYSSLEPGLGNNLNLAFAADCNTLALAGENSLIKLYDVTIAARNGSLAGERRVLKGHAAPVRALAFARDGKTLAAGGADKTIRLWDLATETIRQTLELPVGSTINVVTFSPDGRTLASGGGDLKIRLWDVATGRQLADWPAHDKAVLALAFSARGDFLASGSEDGSVHVWEIKPRP